MVTWFILVIYSDVNSKLGNLKEEIDLRLKRMTFVWKNLSVAMQRGP